MKTGILYLLLTGLLLPAAHAQVAVKVDVAQKIKYLNGRENGINLDYLMDGSYLKPSVPLSTSIKNMGIKLLRYPGGEKADNYLWSAAPWKAASPRMALPDTAKAWPTKDGRFVDKRSSEKLCKPEVLDFDEFMVLSKATGAEPLIVVAYDAIYNSVVAAKPTKEQLVTNAVEWVRYANVTKKFGIKYWMIGNESWNAPDYNGRATPEQYADDIKTFASAMKAVDPTIKIIANGRASWWQTLLQSGAVSYIDILAFSAYPIYDYKEGYNSFRKNTRSLTEEADAAVKAINLYAPTADKKRLKVLASEYNSIDWAGSWPDNNDLGHALCNFQMFGDMLVNPKVEAMCLWNTRWTDNGTTGQHIYDALDKNGNLNATGRAQQVWGKNLLNTMVAATSSDALVKVYASYDTVTQDLNVFLLNKDTAAREVTLTINNYVAGYGGAKFVFGGTSARNKSPLFSWAGALADSAALASIKLIPASVTVFNLLGSYMHLPVNLTSFSGAITNAGVQLGWQLENNESVQQFIIERNANDDVFKPIGMQPVHYTETSSGLYQFLDTSAPAGVPNFYRLKIVSSTGAISYSAVLQFTPSGASGFSVTIAPNPVSHHVQAQVFAAAREEATAFILDAMGRVWSSEKVQLAAGKTNLRLSTPALPRGIYTLKIKTKTQQKAVPFLKL